MPLSPLEQSLAASIAPRRDELMRTLAEWVAVPTGYNATPGLDRQRDLIVARLEALGARTRSVPGTPRPDWLREGERTHEGTPRTVLCTKAGAASSRRVLLCGHLDTVHDPRGEFTSLTISADGATATGPGCADMKGGILVAIAALEALDRAGVPASWTFVLNSDEETGSFCSDAALREEAASREHGGYVAGLVFEPALPDGSLVVERPGSGQFVIECGGKAAHVGRDFTSGVSAVHALARAILHADALADPARGLLVNIGPLEGGPATNIVPELARAWGNVRYSPAREQEAAAALDAMCSESTTLPTTRVRRIFNRPAKPMTPAVETLALSARAAAEDLGQRLPFGATGGVCDGNNMQASGLPVIDTLGVRGGKLHTNEEFLVLDSIVERAQLAAVLMHRLVHAL